MWRWIDDGSGDNDKDKLVDEAGKPVLLPIGTWECPLDPASHGIRVSPKNTKMIAAAPETFRLLKELATTVSTVSNSGEFILAFQMAQIHGVPYTGPQYDKELYRALAYVALMEDE